MQKETVIESWRLCIAPNSSVDKEGLRFTTPEALETSGLETFRASVPGNFELDLIEAGKLPRDIFASVNILKLQDLECMHLWYYTHFRAEAQDGAEPFLRFEGIDTVSEIYLDGALLGTTENMLIPHEFPIPGIAPGLHSLVVHIIPVSVYARRFDLPAKCWGMKYTQDSLLVRKAPAMYGWDIMPRAVSGGLWRPVKLVLRPRQRIREQYLITANICGNSAELYLKASVDTDFDDLRDLTLTLRGVHRDAGGNIDSRFEKSETLFSVNHVMQIPVENAVLWWPKNYGSPELYDVELLLTRTRRGPDGEREFNVPGDEILDRVTFRHGLRTVELERTSLAAPDGKFFFRVNDRRIFVLGTNWVPADTFPSRIDSYTVRGLKLANDIGCNMIRCWGGSPYPSDVLYDYCDEHGIMVWQDFAMACGLYPDDERMCGLVRAEAVAVVKALRRHASLALWSGDNENDIFCQWRGGAVNGRLINRIDPNHNKLTREVIADVVERYDGFRPYIPSSPYMDETVFATGALPSEDHLWGPRDYFKGEYYYDQSVAHFASETGYHGCPAPASLRRFLSEAALPERGDGHVCKNPEWLVHSASMETDPGAPFAYRVPLMTRQVERLFGTAPADIDTYALESQISQAEAMKFFVEHFRIGKGYRSGIIWWNIIDGWPQISDAVVDWYGVKKLAFTYIKRAQQPFCLMCDEPDGDGLSTLCAVSDLLSPLSFTYTVTDALTGEKILTGEANAESDSVLKLGRFKALAGHFYLLRWNSEHGGADGAPAVKGLNHFTGDIGAGVNLAAYKAFMQNAGLWDKLEGFGSL
ncbi:MAG: hypothetical protein IJM24_06295 [Clostridia bacterium]|nr:hypothetical protein [Clostridia bacterium]